MDELHWNGSDKFWWIQQPNTTRWNACFVMDPFNTNQSNGKVKPNGWKNEPRWWWMTFIHYGLDVEWQTNNFGHPNPRRFSLKIANLAMTLIWWKPFVGQNSKLINPGLLYMWCGQPNRWNVRAQGCGCGGDGGGSSLFTFLLPPPDPPSLPPSSPSNTLSSPPLLLCNFRVFILFPVSRGNIHYIHKCIKWEEESHLCNCWCVDEWWCF